MKIRCGNPECGCMIGLESNYKMYKGYLFCSQKCCQDWRKQNDRLKQASDKFNQDPLNYRKPKRD